MLASTRARTLAVALCAAALAACGHEPPPPSEAVPADPHAGHDHGISATFTNGDFETGTMAGWTTGTYLNSLGLSVAPPTLRSQLQLQTGGNNLTKIITGAAESVLPAGLTAGATLRVPKYGSNAVVVNELGASYNVNGIKQSMVVANADVDPNDGKAHVRFALAPVLQNPSHAATQQPYFWATLTNVTKGVVLFYTFNYSNQSGVPWKADPVNTTTLYTDWQSFDISPGAAQLAVGDTVELEVIAGGCSQSGHFGHVYVDGIGPVLPGLGVTATAAASVNTGANLTYTLTYSNNGNGASSNTTISETLPTGTTFVSVSTPGSCTTPAVGGTGTVTCNFGTLNPASTGSFTVTVKVTAASGATVSNGNYSIAATGVSALIGPLVTTAVTSGVTYADLATTATDGVAAVNWGATTTYTVAVRNNGPSTATNATIAVPVPANVASFTGWTCTASGGATCGAASGTGAIATTATLPASGQVSYAITAKVASGTGSSTISLQATATTPSGVTDSNATNDVAADYDQVGTLRTLTLTKSGGGVGTVLSSPSAISCGTACASQGAVFLDGTTVVLTASTTLGSRFTQWTTAPCAGSTSPVCSVPVSADTTVTADFMSGDWLVSGAAAAGGTGSGTISCTSPVLNGGSSTCTVTPAARSRVTALTDNGTSVLGSLSGGIYALTNITADHAVVATFTANTDSIAFSASPATTAFGASTTFTATVTAGAPAGTPTGTVTFSAGATTLCAARALSGGVATCATAALPVGASSVTGAYSGDGTWPPVTSAALGYTVTKATTALSLGAAPSPATLGQSVTLTATLSVTAGAGTPGGTVAFTDGGVSIAGCALVPLSGLTATCTTTAASVASHTYGASYAGDASFAAASGTTAVTVAKGASSTALAAAPSPSVFGQAVTLTATVAPVAPAFGTPTGTVTFLDGATTLGSATLSGGAATLSTSALAAATHALTASYGGDGSLTASSGATSLVVGPAATTTTLTASTASPVHGTAFTLTATVAAVAPGAGTPTGTVSFAESGGGTVHCAAAPLSGGVATCTLPAALAAGAHTFVATSSASASFASSTSAGLARTVATAASAVALASSQNPSTYGSSVTFTATVTGAGLAPTGTVAFADGATTLCAAAAVSAGAATCPAPLLAGGTHAVTATYSGDANHAGAAAPGLSQLVNPAATTLALTSSNRYAPAGTAFTLTATVSRGGATATAAGGTVTFWNGAASLGTGAVSAGLATLTTSSLPAGTYGLTATYAGDASHQASTAAQYVQQVLGTFPIAEPFKSATATGWSMLGSAVLTGNGTTDAAGAGWLRLTSNANNQAGSALYGPPFSSAQGIVVTFDYATWGGTGADGFSFYLIDGATLAPTVGAAGGSLGYSGSTGTCGTAFTTAGVTNGYVGIGFDEFGNYATCNVGTGGTARTPNLVAIRGSGSLTAVGGFNYLAGTAVAAGLSTGSRTGARPVRISIVNQKVKVELDTGSGFTTLVSGVDLATATGQVALPPTFKMGFSGSTGGSNDYHEIRNLNVATPATLTVATSAPATASTGATVSYVVTVGNDDLNDVGGLHLAFPVPAGLSGATWTAVTAGGAAASALSGSGAVSVDLDLPKNGSATVTVTGTLDVATAGTTVTGTASITTPPSIANLGNSSASAGIAVARLATSTAVATSGSPSTYGGTVTFTATVTGAGNVPTGTVAFSDGAATLCAAAAVSAGTATCTTSALAAGAHSVVATYGGDASHLGSASGALSQPVGQATPAVTLASSQDPSSYRGAVTFTATVAPSGAGATPTGTVAFTDGATTLCAAAAVSAGTATCSTSALAVGAHAVVATYAGDASYLAAASAALTQTVDKATPGIALATSASPSTYGAAVTFTATLTGAAGGTTPSGTVAFTDGATTLCAAAAITAGAATCSTSALAVGSHPVVATASGDGNYLGVASATLTQSVGKGTPGVALAASTNPSTYGNSVTFTATVSPSGAGATPTGTVAFTDGATTLCAAAAVSAGTATCATSALAVGAHPVVAAFSGDGSYLAASSATLTQTVSKAAPGIALATSGSPSTYGAPVTFTATLSAAGTGATPTGTVAFTDGATTLCAAAAVSAGTATCSTSALAVGAHPIVAAFGGDGSYLSATASTVTQTVGKATPAVAVAASANPSTYGSPVTFTATVAPSGAGATPTGTVAFTDGATTLCAAVAVSAGTATCSTSALAVGAHAVVATYAGDGSYLTASSATLTQTVSKAAPGIALATSGSPSTYGAPVTFTATLTAAGAGATPTGTVAFTDGATTLCAATAITAGTATCSTSALAVGAHPVVAAFGGDGSYLTATSSTVTQSVGKGTPGVALAPSANPSTYGAPVTFTATVSAAGAGATPTGTIAFTDGATTLCAAAALSGGTATCSTSSLAVGAHPVVAAFTGDGSYLAASSATLAQTVGKATPGVAVASSLNPSIYAQSVTFTATVSAAGAGATPTGTVAFTDGATTLCAAAALSAGTATCTTSALAVASHAIVATYGGNGSYLGAASPALAQVVDTATPTVALAASPNPSIFSGAVTFTATLTGAGATPTGTVAFTDGATVLCAAAAVTTGTATCTTSALAAGAHAITASYGGDATYLAAASPALTQQVDRADASLALTASPSPSAFGQVVTLTATLTGPGATPGGTVSFTEGGAAVAGCTARPVAGGVATCALPSSLAVGVHALGAASSGDATFRPASGTASLTVQRSDPAVALASSNGLSVYGEPLTFTVTVAHPEATPTGTVTVQEGATTLCGPVSLSAGAAACAVPALPVGAHTLTAVYGGDGNYATVTSAAFTQYVARAAATIDAAADLDVAAFGQAVTISATVRPSDPSAATPQGTVTFRDSATVVCANVAVSAGGTATCTTTGLAVGLHTVSARYNGSPQFSPATSFDDMVRVDRAATAAALAPSPAASVFGQPVTLTVTVPAVAPGAGTPTGTVTLTDGGAPLAGCASLVLSGGTRNCTLSGLAVGSHTLAVSYPGDGSFEPSTASLAFAVGQAATATTLASSANPAPHGTAVTFTAAVAAAAPGAGAPSGTVTFSDGATTLGTGAVAGGVATFTTDALLAGPHAIRASYAGDGDFLGSTSAAVAQVTGQAVPGLSASSSPAPSTYGASVTFSATVGPAGGGLRPTGTVTFSDGAAALCSAAVSPATGQAACAHADLAPGHHAVTAGYGGDANYLAASTSLAQDVTEATPTVLVSATPSPSVTGEGVVISVQVLGTLATPTGTVTLLDGAAAACGGTLALVGGAATCPTADLLPGDHVLTATYSGDARYLAGLPGTAAHRVARAATDVALDLSAATSVSGESVVLTATVTVASPGAAPITGTVDFYDGETVIGTGPVDPATGVATLAIPAASPLAVGLHQLSATYSGDANLLGAITPLAAAHLVSQGSVLVTVTGSVDPTAFGQAATFTVSVLPVAPAAGVPAGALSISVDGGAPFTATLAGGEATFSLADLAVGSHRVTVGFPGDAWFLPATGQVDQLVVEATTSLALAASVAPSAFGQPVTFTATIAVAAPGAGTPSGEVILSEGAAVLGRAPLAADGTARLVLDGLAAGSHELVATYPGDGSFAPATGALAQTVVRSATSAALAASAAAPPYGAPLTLTAQVHPVAPGAGLPSGTVTFLDGGAVLGVAPVLADGSATFTTASLTPGAHLLTAGYAGDGSFEPASTAPSAVTVVPAPVALALAAAPTPSVFGEPVRWTVTATAGQPSLAVPVGVVVLKDGATVVATTALDAAGQAGGAIATLEVGAHALTAELEGDARFAAAASNLVDQPVRQGGSAVALTATPSPATFGLAVTLRAAVSAAAPAAGQPGGTVTFLDGASVLGTAAVAADGTATLVADRLLAGAHTLGASYGGDARFEPSAAAPLAQVMNRAPTTTVATAAPEQSVVGQPVVLTATVASSAGTPGGQVRFDDAQAGPLGTATLDAAGVAVLTTAAVPTPGGHLVTAHYLGADDYLPSSAAPALLTVSQATTSVAVTASPTPAVFGQPVTVTAQVAVVAPGRGLPTGTVTFRDGATVLGIAAIDPVTGRASLTLPALASGAHALDAAYGGEASFTASATAAPFAVQVSKADATVALSTSPAGSAFGEPVTLSVTVAPVAPGAGVPSGSVTLDDGVGFTTTVALAGGRASTTTTALAAGPHALVARYLGDEGFNPASGQASHGVARATTALALAAVPGTARAGQVVTLTATVSVPGTGPSVPGTVTFRDGATILGTASLSGGVATLSRADLAVGAHALSAAFEGDASFTASAGEAALTVEAAATTTALAIAPAQARFGQPVTLSATVAPVAPGGGVPAGLVTFLDGEAVLGTAPLAGGAATLTTSSLAAGAHLLRASYGGSAGYLPSAGEGPAQVDQGTTAVAVETSRQPSRRGRPVTFTATVAAVAPATGIPSGQVTFKDGEATLGATALDGGVARFTTRALLKGDHAITAEYGGAAGFEPATGTLPGGQLVENTPPVAAAGTALALGEGGATRATVHLGGALDAGDLTLEAWFLPAAAQAAAAPSILTLGGAAPRLAVGLLPDRSALTFAAAGATRTSPAPLDDGAWHHLAVTASAGTVRLYLDGRLAETIDGVLDGAGDDLVIGAGLDGQVDEVRAWTEARTPAQLEAALRSPLGGDEAGLAGLWRMDEGAGAELFDASAGAHDGAIAVVPGTSAFAPSQAWRWREVKQDREMAPADAGYDADGDALTLTVTTPAASGEAWADAAARQLGYRPRAGFLGADAFAFRLDDGTASATAELAPEVTRTLTCQANADCGGGDLCLQGLCVAPAELSGRSGGCGCTTGAGAASGLWAVLALGLLRRRRPRGRA